VTYKAETEINIGKVDLQDEVTLIERRFDKGRDIVFIEENYDHHEIYMTRDLMTKLGGYMATNKLVRLAFDAISETDPTKTRFFFGQSYRIGRHEVWGFDIYFPRGSFRPLAATQDTFLQAIEKKLK